MLTIGIIVGGLIVFLLLAKQLLGIVMIKETQVDLWKLIRATHARFGRFKDKCVCEYCGGYDWSSPEEEEAFIAESIRIKKYLTLMYDLLHESGFSIPKK